MIDPDAIQTQKFNLPNFIDIKNVSEFDFDVYNHDDEKQHEHYIKDVENTVRHSLEYKEFIKYIRNNMSMNHDAFLKNISNEDTFDIKIEIHHYPFSLHDIASIVYNKRSYYNESVTVQMVAKEVMQLHYKLMVGLIPLSETVHELYHKGRLFIPVDKILGRYQLFIRYYRPFIDPELLDSVERAEKYTDSNYSIADTTILEQNHVHYDITDTQYQLPQFKPITDNLFNQIQAIKENNYLLPTAQQAQAKMIEAKKEPAICPVYFIQDK
jgi:hypothetical protein